MHGNLFYWKLAATMHSKVSKYLKITWLLLNSFDFVVVVFNLLITAFLNVGKYRLQKIDLLLKDFIWIGNSLVVVRILLFKMYVNILQRKQNFYIIHSLEQIAFYFLYILLCCNLFLVYIVPQCYMLLRPTWKTGLTQMCSLY